MANTSNFIRNQRDDDRDDRVNIDSIAIDEISNPLENRLAISDMLGLVFHSMLNSLSERQKEIVDLVKKTSEKGSDFKDLNNSGYSLAEVMELVRIGILHPSDADDNKFIYREFLKPKKK